MKEGTKRVQVNDTSHLMHFLKLRFVSWLDKGCCLDDCEHNGGSIILINTD